MSTPPAGFEDAAVVWNRRYAAAGYLFGTEPNGWLQQQAHRFPARGRILCVADGEGRNGVWLAQQGHAVESFDIAEVAVGKARALAAQAGVDVAYQVASCDDYAWPEAACDGVAAIFVQFAPPALRERMFAHIVRSLRPGGVLVLQGYTPRQLEYRTGGPPHVEHLYTAELLREAFRELKLLELTEYEAEVHEGSGHHGRSALIGLVAQR